MTASDRNPLETTSNITFEPHFPFIRPAVLLSVAYIRTYLKYLGSHTLFSSIHINFPLSHGPASIFDDL